MDTENIREIPYNYTSADDALIVRHLFGQDVWEKLESLRSQRVTGKSARLLMRFFGDIFILQRNPFLYQELIDSIKRRRLFFKNIKKDLHIIENAGANSDVNSIISSCRKYIKNLSKEISGASKTRRAIKKALGSIIGEENVCFDPFSLISHSTDATDWRLYLPVAVVMPTNEEQVPELLGAIEKLKLRVIPRGAGTGLTGGSVPIGDGCVIINTEKLNRIHGITEAKFHPNGNGTVKMPVIKVESGVITDNAMDFAQEQNLVFATDPTSAWACTIGGNIAENAGGKTAVLWGTAIDNIVSYKIAMPGGHLYEVKRTNHQLRKILPGDTVSFEITDDAGSLVRKIDLKGTDIRKQGLWKDITNKALGGLPGVQKEGTDGIITSAEFILYKAYEHKKTFCLEFFGEDMEEASRVIVEMSNEFVNEGAEALMALEHFDDEYMKAINYKVKAPRSESPKAVLLIDMVGHNTEQIDRGVERFKALIDPYDNTSVFVAKDKEEAERFWRDRKRLGAIAARTNAFKLNEDIVLPLEALADFASYVERYNIEENRYNQEAIVHEILTYIDRAEPIEDPDWLKAKIPTAQDLCNKTRKLLTDAGPDDLISDVHIKKLYDELMILFRGYKRVIRKINELIDKTRERRIVIATHMHAGDGNVHVNIPVFSNDREMMIRANITADNIMAKAVKLDGVVSGEHGIGITKMKYLDTHLIKELNKYRKSIDPKGVMNPGKLVDTDIHNKVFTPSFNLLEFEARILQHGSLETLAAKISNCIRCGKCKPDCCTFYPSQNLFFHPRNKNLAIASLIEAMLYDAQRSHSTRFRHLKHLEEVADHCTMCHKCFKPCPVDIDTAEISILEREILATRKYKHSTIATKLSLMYLHSRSAIVNRVFRTVVLKWAGDMQRLGAKLMARVPDWKNYKKLPPFNMLNSAVPPASPQTLWDIFPGSRLDQAYVINPPGKAVKTVFYFPGCGSERLFSDVSKAAVYTLLKASVRVVLPPPFLCCGFPSKVNAQELQHSHVTLRDTIIFTQIREMLGYLHFDACLVSCGTCCEALKEIDTEDIFDCEIEDISKFVLENGLEIESNGDCLYHAPCHDSLDGKAVKLLNNSAGYNVKDVPHCCSEAGTMALSRPDISGSMLERKRDAIIEAMNGSDDEAVILTNCPSCLQGLGRNKMLNAVPRHIAVELAMKTGGNTWEEDLKRLLANAEAVNF